MADTPTAVATTGGGTGRRARGGGRGSFSRVVRFTAMRLLALFFTVLVGVYLTVLIANMAGYVDELRRGQIREGISLGLSMDPEFRQLSQVERTALLQGLISIEEERLGLNRPFMLRSLAYLKNAITLSWEWVVVAG